MYVDDGARVRPLCGVSTGLESRRRGGGGVVVVVKSSPGPPSHARASLSTATAAAAAVATRAPPSHTYTLTHVNAYTRTPAYTPRTPDVRCVAYAVGAC